MKVVGVVGAGQLGSRHLQALAGVKEPLTIYVLDISEQALNIARDRFNDVNTSGQHVVYYVTEQEVFPRVLNVAIVATNSIIRKTVVEQLLRCCKVDHLILEKFLFPKLSDFETVDKLFAKFPKMEVWVNCPRRTFDLYKGIAGEIKKIDSTNLSFSVIGSRWGLACNSIHFVDLFGMLTGEDEVKVLNEDIDNEFAASKREGYIEFSGTLVLGTPRGRRMTVTSFKTGSVPLMIEIVTPEYCWKINEANKIMLSGGERTKWKFEEESFVFPLQSEAGTTVVEQLLKKDTCELTPYLTSEKLHRTLLTTFLRKYNELNIEQTELCPIT